MKYASLSDVINFSWRDVFLGYWYRYPNPKSGHVVSDDVIHREVRSGKLCTRRLIQKVLSAKKIPSWFRRFLSTSNFRTFVVEESIVDLNSRTITSYTRNVGGSFCNVDEKCTYTPVENGKVHVYREVFVNSDTRLVGGKIESYVFKSFVNKSAPASLLGFRYVLTRMFHPEDLPQIEQELAHSSDTLTDKAKELKEKTKEKVHEEKEKMREKKKEITEKTKEKFRETKEKMIEKKKELAEKTKEKFQETKEKIIEKEEKLKDVTIKKGLNSLHGNGVPHEKNEDISPTEDKGKKKENNEAM